MRIMFASSHPYLPQIAGGCQSNTHESAIELMRRGHSVSVLAGLTGRGPVGLQSRMLLKLSRKAVARTSFAGYPVYRSWFPWKGLAHAVARERPDVVVAQPGAVVRLALEARAIGVPVVVYLHNVEFDEHGGPIEALDVPFLANSEFTAKRYRDVFGIESTMIPPLFQPERYRTNSTRERVLFINPHPLKGLERALEIAAATPDIAFDFVESWTLTAPARASLLARLEGLPNVTLHPRSDDMRRHYGRARIVLVPSMWEETWGRVASEAHYNAIPVIATKIGGLVEAVGPGGVVIDPAADTQAWVTALRRLWDDPDAYAAASAAAAAYSERPLINCARQIETLLDVLGQAIEGSRESERTSGRVEAGRNTFAAECVLH